jgi:hypothetical protein
MPVITLDRKTVTALPLPLGKACEFYWDAQVKGLAARSAETTLA